MVSFFFFWLTFTFLICCCILTTPQIIFGVSILTVIVKSWLNDIRRIYRFPILYQWENNIPSFSIAFFHLVTTNPTQWYTNQRVTRYELMSLRVSFIARVMSYELFLLQELRVTFCIRVMSYCLLYELPVTFIARVTSYGLLCELRVTFCIRVTGWFLYASHELLFNYELQ